MSWILVKTADKTTYTYNYFFNCKSIQSGNIEAFCKDQERFYDDKSFYENKNFIFILDGVMLNKEELYDKYETNNMFETAIEMYKRNGQEFMKEFRGPFSGVLYDKEKDSMIVFTNQTGDAPTFTFQGEKSIAFSNDFNELVSFIKENNLKYSFNPIAANHLLTFGYFVDENTYMNEIQRLRPGRYLFCKGEERTENIYFQLENTSFLVVTLDEAVELIDKAFKKAVKRCFDKDLEYGYNHHLADMSGGFDSRMTTWVAKSLGYDNITNVCYGKSGSVDEKAAKEVTSYLKNELIWKPLDNLKFFYDVDTNTKMNFGMAEYCGITGGQRLLSDINFKKYGLEHTGQLGDVVVGTFCNRPYHTIPDGKVCRFSDVLPCDYQITNQFENHEQYCFYIRGFQAALSTHCIRRNYTEAVSPFCDVDFLSLCMTIPISYRYQHKLYWKWIEKKYPQASKIISTRKKKRKNLLSGAKGVVKLAVGKNKKKLISIITNMGLVSLVSNPKSMNPLDYWYEKDSNIKKYYQNYFIENIHCLHAFPDIEKKASLVFQKGNASEKAMVLTLLSGYQLYFNHD